MNDADERHGGQDASASPAASDVPAQFTHINERGEAKMVDITGKQPTQRRALARCRVTLAREAFDAVILDMQHGALDFAGASQAILAVALAEGRALPDAIHLCHGQGMRDGCIERWSSRHIIMNENK